MTTTETRKVYAWRLLGTPDWKHQPVDLRWAREHRPEATDDENAKAIIAVRHGLDPAEVDVLDVTPR